jgi:hypothetical protein
MYVVGLDVDTCVSSSGESLIITIWLYAGNFLFLDPDTIDGTILETSVCLAHMQLLYTTEQSAGNLKIVSDDIQTEDLLSVHTPKHHKPKTDMELGYYLAGLIEGDGYLNRRGFEILFREYDLSSAHYIKSIIGYGSISKVKDKKAYKLSITNFAGALKV